MCVIWVAMADVAWLALFELLPITAIPLHVNWAYDTAGPKARAKAIAKVAGFLTVDLPMTR
jgi:hypothetical protein